MLDILAIKADVYQLERQGKRLPVYRYLQEVWQKEPPSEGLTVLALQQMVDYVEYVDDLTVLGEPWEAENEYDLYQDFLLDVISWGLQKYRAKKAVFVADLLLCQCVGDILLYLWQGNHTGQCGAVEENAF